jgi:hypothetical protein
MEDDSPWSITAEVLVQHEFRTTRSETFTSLAGRAIIGTLDRLGIIDVRIGRCNVAMYLGR